jgi:hypothetical protein
VLLLVVDRDSHAGHLDLDMHVRDLAGLMGMIFPFNGHPTANNALVQQRTQHCAHVCFEFC